MAKKLNPKKFPNGIRRILYGDARARGKYVKLKGRMLVFREKHGTRYFPADTPEKTMYSCLQILTERFGPDGSWGTLDDYIEELKQYGPDEPEMPLEEAEKLPYENIKKQVAEQWKEYKEAKKQRAKEIRSYELMKKAIEEEDPYLALKVIWDRRTGEYENVDFEWLADVKENGFFDRMTWICHACGERRPDDKISVSSEKVQSSKSNYVFLWHVRYCNDKSKCRKMAREMSKMENPWDHPGRKEPNLDQ